MTSRDFAPHSRDRKLEILFCGDLEFDFRRRIVSRNGIPLNLSEDYRNVILLLVERSPDSVRSAELAEAAGWSGSSFYKVIEAIRAAVGDAERPPRLIVNERGVGYRFIGEVAAAEPGIAGGGSRSPEGGAESATKTDAAAEPASPARTRRIRRYWAALVAILAIAAAVAVSLMLTSGDRPQPHRAEVVGNSLQAYDGEGRPLWSHRYAGQVVALSPDEYGIRSLVRIADLRGDGHREAVVAVPTWSQGGGESGEISDPIQCLSSDGKVLWSYEPQTELRFGRYSIGPPWYVNDVYVSVDAAGPAVLAALSDHRWGISIVVKLDPRSGSPKLLFVNTGTIRKLAEWKAEGGSYLLAGGFNNEYDGGMLAVLREERGLYVSPQTRGTRHFCESCAGNPPDYYVVFPRSELNMLEGERAYEQSVIALDAHPDEVIVGLRELKEFFRPRAFYALSPRAGFEPLSLRFDTGYDLRHRELEGEGRLRHALAECPERRHPSAVRIWTPREGWREKAPPPLSPVE